LAEGGADAKDGNLVEIECRGSFAAELEDVTSIDSSVAVLVVVFVGEFFFNDDGNESFGGGGSGNLLALLLLGVVLRLLPAPAPRNGEAAEFRKCVCCCDGGGFDIRMGQ
jgi:hypothetical protein